MAGLSTLFANETCQNNLYWEIITFFVECIITSILLVLCIRVLMDMNDNKSLKVMRFLHLTHILFYASSIICSILYINNHFIYCFTANYSSVADISWIVAIISYVLHWGAVLLALFFRLYYIFYDTAYQISKIFICMFFTLFFIGGITALLPAVYFDYIIENELYSLLSGGLLLFFIIIFHAVLSLQFIYKLFQVTTSIERHDSSNNLNGIDDNNNNDNNNNNNNESKMVIMIRKYTILAVLSSIGAILLLISFLICIVIGEIDNFFDNILMIFYMFNVFINVLCISLALSLYHGYYVKYCHCLDIRCRICCNKLAQTYIQNPHSARWSTLQSDNLSSSDEDEPVDL